AHPAFIDAEAGPSTTRWRTGLCKTRGSRQGFGRSSIVFGLYNRRDRSRLKCHSSHGPLGVYPSCALCQNAAWLNECMIGCVENLPP
ncbi:unnamed protein product, partial [Mycena citricolor]